MRNAVAIKRLRDTLNFPLTGRRPTAADPVPGYGEAEAK
jgi:hypothetical protein